MRRVVVTGQGIVSSLGNNTEDVTRSLRDGRSGLRFNPVYAERGLRSPSPGEIVKVTEAVLTYVAVDEKRQKRPVPPE